MTGAVEADDPEGTVTCRRPGDGGETYIPTLGVGRHDRRRGRLPRRSRRRRRTMPERGRAPGRQPHLVRTSSPATPGDDHDRAHRHRRHPPRDRHAATARRRRPCRDDGRPALPRVGPQHAHRRRRRHARRRDVAARPPARAGPTPTSPTRSVYSSNLSGQIASVRADRSPGSPVPTIDTAVLPERRRDVGCRQPARAARPDRGDGRRRGRAHAPAPRSAASTASRARSRSTPRSAAPDVAGRSRTDRQRRRQATTRTRAMRPARRWPPRGR